MSEANKSKRISKTWISGQNSCTLVIPKSIAKSYGLEEPANVIVEAIAEGILIKKLEA